MSIKLPSVLSFERKLEPSDALMYAGNWGGTEKLQVQGWQIVQITKRQNRGTKSSLEHKTKPKELIESNLVEGDDANLPHGKDTLKVSFSLRIIGNVGKPFACNEPAFDTAISGKMNLFKEEGAGIESLAFRYAYNIANGRFLWRNRVGAEKIVVKVKTDAIPEGTTFKAYDFSLNDFEKNSDDIGLKKLAKVIFSGLNGDENTFSYIEVDAYVKLGNGQHVFPSQEMNMGEKKKVLFRLAVEGNECAAIHNVKIGNAIRTIDNWYANAKFPIAVEPYGSVTQMGQAYRKTRDDLYSLMLKWLNDKETTAKDKEFVVANLIRGGVFGGKSE